MNEDKLLVFLARAHAGFFGCRQFDLLLYYRISVVVWLEFVTATTIVVHTTQLLLLSITIIYPHTKQLNMIWLVYCVTELVLLDLFLLFILLVE